MTRFRFLLLVVLAAFLAVAPSASADPMIKTGSSIRTKSFFGVSIKLYAITHYMAAKPANKSKQDVINADVSKQFSWSVMHDLPADKVKKALQDAFTANGYKDQGKINQFLAPISAELPEKSSLTIAYDANTKNTTITTPNGKATVNGVDFMKGVWSIWFGVIDQPSMGDQLIANL